MSFKSSITKRVRKRKNKAGEVVLHTRHVLNYKHPADGKRRQEFFERRAEAQDRQSQLAASIEIDPFFDPMSGLTVSKAVDHWLENKQKRVKASSYAACLAVVEHIRGPVLIGTRDERAQFKKTGIAPVGTDVQERLGKLLVSELRTAHIRTWFNEVRDTSGAYTARRAKSFFGSVLALSEEDFGIRVPSMPTQLGKGNPKTRKLILEPQQVAQVIQEAQADSEHGLYYAFPFLAGTRPSEQLGLLWSEVDFDQNTIRICRIQERDGTLCETTKTAAGTREVPMGGTLRAMLLQWRLRCPREAGELYRVFPGPGRLQPWPLPRLGGGPLLYQNWRRRYWQPVFKRLGLPYVTPHSARHTYISTLQAQGIEVGLVAKMAGHANPTVTLGIYTQAVRGGEDAVRKLDEAYSR
ncbi:tyrosine-type recombinase/integrase [Pyruvatibacter sp.]|uniref:site-specific integrase n=1 Tax=Pyruvatibacter sp. TaxID=1981328 RepID=UPI0032ED95F7